MKYIIACLSVFLLVLSVTVFAQENDSVVEESQLTLEELLLLEENLTEEPSDISEEERESIMSCVDLDTNQVEINMNSPHVDLVSGMAGQFNADLKNITDKTISNGTLYVKFFRESNEDMTLDIVDHFVIKENINLLTNETITIPFTWNVPSVAESGNYRVAAFFYTDNRFDISGNTLNNNFAGGQLGFNITGETEGSVWFDANDIQINNQEYVPNTPPVVVLDMEDVFISAPIKNTTTEDKNVQIEWKVYKFDAKDENNLVKKINSDATILAGESYSAQLVLNETDSPSYHIVGELKDRDSKSIIEIRYTREGVGSIQMISSSVDSYPMVKNQDNSMSVCLYSNGNPEIIRDHKVVLELKNSRGKVIESHIYEGVIVDEPMLIKKDFKSTKNLNTFSLNTTIWAGDKMVDTATVTYDCKALNSENCTESALSKVLYSVLGFVLIILLLIVALKINKRKIGSTLPMFTLLILLGFIYPNISEAAKSTSVSSPSTTMSTSGYQWWLRSTLTGARISASYSADVRNADTNAVIADGSSVPVGTRLKFIASNGSASWSSSSPWASGGGSFISGAGQPTGCTGYYTNTLEIYKSSSNAYSQSFSSSHIAREYINASVNPPSATISKTGNLSCGGISGGVMTCTVTGPGAIGATFTFAGSYAKLHRSLYHQYYNITNGVNGCYDKVAYTPQVSLGSASISYNLTATPVEPVNVAPNPPVITGPTTGNPSTNYTFGFRATDPGDTIRYGVSWDNDNTVDEWIPASGYVASNTTRNGTKSWGTTGTKTFKARTQDNEGLTSGWTSYSITLSNPPVNGSCGSTTNSCTAGSFVDTADNSTNYRWNCNGTNGGSNVSCTYPIPPPAVNGSCGSTTNSCTAGTLFDIADSSTEYLWRCRGVNGGTVASCSVPIPVVVTGVCGSSTNSCTSGTFVDVTDTSTNYRWSCNGSNGGANSSCSLSIPPSAVNGSCGTANNVCTSGSLLNIADTSSNYLWNCNGSNGGTNASCTLPKPAVNGQCSSTNHMCVSGTLSDVTDTATNYLWNCNGSNGGSNQSCSAPIPVVPSEPTATFIFDPGIVATASGRCSLIVDAQDVSSCRLIKNGITESVSPSINSFLLGTSITINGQIQVPIGRYILECTGIGTSPVTKTLGVQSCIVNPDIRES